MTIINIKDNSEKIIDIATEEEISISPWVIYNIDKFAKEITEEIIETKKYKGKAITQTNIELSIHEALYNLRTELYNNIISNLKDKGYKKKVKKN